MLLIYPPAARTSEAPLGLARLAGHLRARGVAVRALDLCMEGYQALLSVPVSADGADTWTCRAVKGREASAAALRGPAAYGNIARYRRYVGDLNRALAAAVETLRPGRGIEVTLSDYRDAAASPHRKGDLIAQGRSYRENLFYPFFAPRLEGVLEKFPARRVGVSLNYLSQALCAFALLGFLRERYPDKELLLGGALVNSWLALGRITGDERFGGLVDAVLGGRGEDALDAYLGPCAGAGTPVAPRGAPDFTDFAGLPYFAPERIIPYNFSSGCPWKRCSFCPERAEDGRYRGLPPAGALAELAFLVSATDAGDRDRPPSGPPGGPPGGLIHFTDNELSPTYLRALAGAPPGLPWYGFARFSRALAEADFCRRLAASGCVMLQLGLESGDQEVLDAMGKGTRLPEIEAALENLHEAGIGTFIYVLFGTPEENRDAALRTRDFVASHARCIDYLNVAIFNMPAAAAARSGLETRQFGQGDLSLYHEFAHPAGWNRDRVRAFLARDFETEPEIRAILRRCPPVFTSNHAPLFLRAATAGQKASQLSR